CPYSSPIVIESVRPPPPLCYRPGRRRRRGCNRLRDGFSAGKFQAAVDGVQVDRENLKRCQCIVPAVKRLVSLVAWYLLPRPWVTLVGIVDFCLGEQALEIGAAVIVPPGKVAVFGAGGLHFEVVHDDLLARINAQLVLPAGADLDLTHNDLLFFGWSCIGPVLAVEALDAERLFAQPGAALHPYILGEMAAFVHK